MCEATHHYYEVKTPLHMVFIHLFIHINSRGLALWCSSYSYVSNMHFPETADPTVYSSSTI